MLRDPMGLIRTWADVPRGFEEDLKGWDSYYAGGSSSKDHGPWLDVTRGLPNSGFVSGVGNQGSGDFFSSGASHSSSSTSSHDGSSSSVAGHPGDNTTDAASLSSYLMDGSVRAMLKKVTVNEGALNQTIQSLGGGEKGLKELMGYIMSWVREHKAGENSAKFDMSQNFENLHKPPPPVLNSAQAQATFGYGATNPSQLGDGPHDAHVLHQFYQPCTKSRRLGDGVDSSGRSDACLGGGATFVDVRGSILGALQYPKLETVSTGGGSSSIGPVMMMPGIILDAQQQPVAPSPGVFSFASGHDDLSRSSAATTRAARRNRIARQRRSVAQLSLPRGNGTAVSSGCGLWSVAPPTGGVLFHPGVPQMASPAAVPTGRLKVNIADTLTFLLQKELRPSDVGNLGRIVLPKKEAEMHLPILTFREGVLLQMEDFDSGYCWNVRYRFWPNNKSRMYLLENTGEMVKSHHLQEGDLLILYRNQQGNYVLRGKKKVHSGSSRGGAQGSQQKHAHSLARGFPEASKTEEVLKERNFGLQLQDRSCPKGLAKERAIEWESEDRYDQSDQKVVKAEPTVFVGDDDPFFKEDVMHNIGSTFGPGLLQPLERFPSLNLDFPLDEIMALIPKDDNDSTMKVAVEPKPEPAE